LATPQRADSDAAKAATAETHAGNAAYVAHLAGLNSKVTGDASGEARFTIKGDTLTIRIALSRGAARSHGWTTPTLVEICIGLEINAYLPPDF
jgi:coenzyme PQQ precursor peptide PqqA